MKDKGGKKVLIVCSEDMSIEDAMKVDGYIESYEEGEDYANHTKEVTR